MSVTQQPRRRDAAATREAILNSAIEAFTRAGYDGAGVREVAAAAGVTAMLVNRYFGSKEQLFAEVVNRSFAPPTIVGDDPAELPAQIARALVDRTDPAAAQLSPFLLMLRSAGNPRAAEIMHDAIAGHAGSRLTGLLDGADADQRAELILALIAGVWLMRSVIATPALTGADPAALTARLTIALQALSGPGH
ncbi:TetR family transcriptional regulator [Catellatospora methionotrophica]|uniref:TetR family transcriptional regulator n=1 Tax=Catellatospora methionotrophica TaxID=121620 RepID=A0A8J3LAU4_9ACTN|nr:TetR/AcrR family transcriptional regulator [Catellatospora methionotrophica]GIG14954.1 TetR family transcriptional regulator [Catellatospora methionotrophica]